MDRLTEQDFLNATKPIVRLTLENLHLRTALAQAKQQGDANDDVLGEIAAIVHDVYTNPAREPTPEERKIAKLFRVACE